MCHKLFLLGYLVSNMSHKGVIVNVYLINLFLPYDF